MKSTLLAVIVAALLTSPVSAKAVPVGNPVGKWVIFGEPDPMTDKMSCIAFYGGKRFVQATSDSFAVGYGGRGGLKGYELRFDNDAALGMTSPVGNEERIGAFILNDTDSRFARLLIAKRLRVQTLTVLNSIASDDIDLTDLPRVMAKLKGPECS